MTSSSVKRKREHEEDAIAGLRRFFPGMTSFKDGQKQVVEALLRGENAAAIFPTGGGKSLCYQLPGLMLAKEGLTVVVSPLKALMKDQVDTLKRLGRQAERLDSSLTLPEKIEVMNNVRERRTALLYVAPEQLNNEKTVALIQSVPIALLAIDEVHCVSEWGNAFRPDYLRISKIAKKWNVCRVVDLTATATPNVVTDICNAFDIPRSNCVRTSFYRPNLKLAFTPAPEDKRDAILVQKVKAKPAGATIVYTTVQKTTELVADVLRQAGINARPYHAGLDDEIRKDTQEWFMQPGTARVVVATIAFGMGVDKADIRYVYHYNLPKSLEGYAQEIGRAGRDGEESHCEILCDLHDCAQLESFAYCGAPTKAAIQGVLGDFFKKRSGALVSAGTTVAVSQYQLGRANDMNSQGIQMLLAFLDIYEGLVHQGTPQYGQFRVKPREGSCSRVPSLLKKCGDPQVAAILSKYCSVKQIWAHIDVSTAATKHSDIPRDRFMAALNQLESAKLLVISPSHVEHVYHIIKVPKNLDSLAATLHGRFQDRQTKELSRIGEVLAFISAGDCQTRILTEHFEGSNGPSQSGDPFPCKTCPYCLTGKAIQLPKPKQFTIEPKLWKLLKAENLPRDDPHLIARFALGFRSPRLTNMKLTKRQNFGLMQGAPFDLVLNMVNAIFF